MKSASRRRSARIIFITGTDTGVGKTLLTGMLVHHLRAEGHHALAMKPFCSGGTADADFLSAIQDGELTAEEVNPFYFSEPVAPLVSARKHRRNISLVQVLHSIQRLASRCGILLIEGSGGLMVPLGKNYSVATVIKHLKCETIVVGRNRLGVINHTLLTVGALRQLNCHKIKVVLMGDAKADLSAHSNAKVLSELLGQLRLRVPLVSVGYLGKNAMHLKSLKDSRKKIKKMLAQVLK